MSASLCLLVGGAVAATLPADRFTLAWTHSVEKIRWEEDYRIEAGKLVLSEARIRGSGAGMEPPAGARLEGGVWHYRPALAPIARLALARSATVADYQLCLAGTCHTLAEYAGRAENSPVVELVACDAAHD